MLIKNLNKKNYLISGKKFKTNYIACEVCKSKKNKLFQNCGKIGDNPGQYGYLPIRICLNCSLKFISPRPSNLYYKKFFNLDYGKTYYGSKYKPNKEYIKFQKIRGNLVYKYFSKIFTKEIKILDHGCGVGTTMLPWKKNNYKIQGFDPHLPSINYGIQRFKLDIELSFGEKLKYQKENFDLIISLGSLEHCFDINKCLKEIWRVLKKKGKLIIRWRSDKLIGSPLEYFGHATLKYLNITCWQYLLKSHGFKVIKKINKKIEGYDSFEYLIVEKSNPKKKKSVKIKNLNSQYKKFKNHFYWYKNICSIINDKKNSFYIKKFKDKKDFIKKNKIGLMNLSKKKSIERFFKETTYFNNFLKTYKIKELYKY